MGSDGRSPVPPPRRAPVSGSSLAPRTPWQRSRDELGGAVPIAVADLADRHQLEQAWSTLTRELGPVDILVNNAGVGIWGPFVDTREDDVDAVISLNLVAALQLTRARAAGHDPPASRPHRQHRLDCRSSRRAVRGDLLDVQVRPRRLHGGAGAGGAVVPRRRLDGESWARHDGVLRRRPLAVATRRRGPGPCLQPVWHPPSSQPSNAATSNASCPAGCALLTSSAPSSRSSTRRAPGAPPRRSWRSSAAAGRNTRVRLAGKLLDSPPELAGARRRRRGPGRRARPSPRRTSGRARRLPSCDEVAPRSR